MSMEALVSCFLSLLSIHPAIHDFFPQNSFCLFVCFCHIIRNKKGNCDLSLNFLFLAIVSLYLVIKTFLLSIVRKKSELWDIKILIQWRKQGSIDGFLNYLKVILIFFKIIKSNQITFIVTSPQHKCLGEWNSWERAPDSAEKQNNLHIDSTYLQTVQKTMCKIHTHILNIHSVL